MGTLVLSVEAGLDHALMLIMMILWFFSFFFFSSGSDLWCSSTFLSLSLSLSLSVSLRLVRYLSFILFGFFPPFSFRYFFSFFLLGTGTTTYVSISHGGFSRRTRLTTPTIVNYRATLSGNSWHSRNTR